MVTLEQLRALAKRAPCHEGLLTAYINVDQSRATNLKRGYERALSNSLRDAETAIKDDGPRRKFRGDAEAVRRFLREHTVGERTLLVLSDSSDRQFEAHSLSVSVTTQTHWGTVPYIHPLAEAYDEYDRYAVALVDRARARLFVVCMREVVERMEVDAESDVHQFGASGKDKMRSQKNFQRKQDIHVLHHLKSVAASIDRLVGKGKLTGLVLGGADKAASELRKLLPERLRKLEVGSLPLPVDSDEKAFVRASWQAVTDWERRAENELVAEMVTAAAKGQGAVVTLAKTLEACVEGRVHTLVYARGYTMDDSERRACLARLEQARKLRPRWDRNSESFASDILEWMVATVLRRRGTIERVQEKAAERLNKRGAGIGAVLSL